ncbi:SurA N-terminal domain-containing protein [Roseibium salinum]|uniref:Parvulin-like PPIase n=1 Tax=Roseibium salinum TaxID=1604349 RepID=A0ABT3R025_9HYPH|nr:SurA N-terminal domain-containing protein [Roseibium sp. DSM 29163]MCX2722578.1 SurA N-terminal domain-containing protein [Roseibium sp. DSM 29163]
MLDALRRGAGTWIAKLFIALLILSFGIWGITGFFQGYGQNTAATVGDTEVTLLDFERTYRQDLNRLSQQFGRPLTPAEGAAFGIPQQSLGKLIAEAAMNDAAENLKLGVTDERLATIIQSDPAFQGPGGRYDRNRLQQVLRANGYSEDEYVLQRRNIAERSQLAEGIAGGMKAPVSYLEALHTYQQETRTAEYLLVTPEHIGEIEDPSDEVLSAYFEENKADFHAPEYRKIRYIALTPDTLARPEEVAEEDARAEYERRKQDFHEPERRKVRQLSFPSQEAAEEAAAKLQGDATFEDLMAERNLSDSDVTLGVMAKDDFLDEALGEAAFSLAEGQSSGAVEGRFSTVILNVQEIQPEHTQPFEEVKAGIVQDLSKEQAEREILDLLDEVEDARAGGALLDEIGERFSLPVEAPEAFDSSGKSISGGEADLPDAEGLIEGAFDSDIGIENDILQFGERGYLWYDVVEVIPSRERTLDEVRDDVVAAWKQDQLAKRLNDTAAELLAKAEGGTPLEDLATEAGLEVRTATDLQRNAPSEDLGREAISAVFSGPVGTVATAPAADQGRLVLKVTGATVPEFDLSAPEVAAIGDQVSQQLQDTLIGQFVSDQEDKAGVEVNNAAIARIVGLEQN